MLDRRRHAPVARPRVARSAASARGLPQVYRGRARRIATDIYDADHAESRHAGRFRWLLSTCLAAAVGILAIGIVIFGSLDSTETTNGLPSVFQRIRDSRAVVAQRSKQTDGLRWSVPKSDRMQPMTGVTNVRHLIHEQIQVKRNGKAYIDRRPYVRVVTRLQPVPPANADVIPAFNPFALYGAQGGEGGKDASVPAGARTDFKFEVKELLGVSVPGDDGQDFETNDITDIVAEFMASESQESALRQVNPVDAGETGSAASQFSRPVSEGMPANTTVLHKKLSENDDTGDDLERPVQRIHTVQRGERLITILQRQGGDGVQVRVMLEAMRQVIPESQIVPGLQVHITLVPSLTRPDSLEPARFSVFTEAGEHKVSVMRNSAGEFVASATPFESLIARAALTDGDTAKSSSIYSALYNAALMQGIPPETIMAKLRVHAYDTDFRRRIASGDYAEYFFDIREDHASGEGAYGELLYTGLSTGGETHRYWRFRTPDGVVDYYDETGNNSKKFLMRRPVRGEGVQLRSGFGVRMHPILNFMRPHNGVDWAGPIGTPILASGNGVIEEAKFKGEFGNYIRIRHANGYHTSYAHMSRYAPRSREGARVRQGEVIGYIGSTGLSAGPHLHFEILVNSRPVDPLSIQVPRERQLTGKPLADFQRERARIDDLMRRQPVSVDNR